MSRSGVRSTRRAGAVGLAFLTIPAALALAPADDTVLVSRATGPDGAKGAAGGEYASVNASISADGRFVSFESQGANLAPDDRSGDYDVFVRDLRSNRTVLASRASGRRGRKGDQGSGDAAISGDGRSVAFTSDAANLDPDVPGGYDFVPIYVRDLVRDRTAVVSRASGARGALPNESSYQPSLSGDGRFVVFHSEASNLHPADRGRRADVFVRDRRTRRTILVSRASGARGSHGDDLSENASISADGRFVTFESRASNLHPDDPDHRRDVFVRDLRRNRTLLVSRASGPDGVKGDGVSIEAAISADGRFVAFVFRRGANLDPDDRDRARDVYLRDLRAGTTVLVSRAIGPSGTKSNGSSFGPTVSAGGRFVAFDSRATNLDPADPDRSSDVFVRDLAAAATRLVSRASGPAGPKAAGPERLFSGGSSIAAGARFVVYDSNAPNLHPDDRDVDSDVFVRELGEPPGP